MSDLDVVGTVLVGDLVRYLPGASVLALLLMLSMDAVGEDCRKDGLITLVVSLLLSVLVALLSLLFCCFW